MASKRQEAGPSTSMDIDPNNMSERDEQIEMLMKVIDIIINESGNTISDQMKTNFKDNIIDIDLSDEISGVLMTVFTCLRKEENDRAGYTRYYAYNATIGVSTVSIGTIVSKIKADKTIKLDFKVATPIVEIMTLFRGFFDEVRTGVNKFRVRSETVKTRKRLADGSMVDGSERKPNTHNLGQYGLVNHHIPLLQGITLAPERRTGVIRSLGPLTQCILLTLEDKYHTKLRGAIMNFLQMLPMASEICNVLQNAKQPSMVSGIMKELGDIPLITTARSTQKFYFPLLYLCYAWRTKSTGFQWSFSGAAMIKQYNVYIATGLRFKIKSGGEALLTAECVFHAIFGTYLEDLKVLETITDHKGRWHNRKEMNPVFMKRSTCNPITFKPISFTMVSKMAQALQTKSLGNIEPVSTSRPSFSGIRKRNFTDEFLSYLKTGKSAHAYSSDPNHLQYALKALRDQLVNYINAEKILAAGTVKWEEQGEDGTWIESNKEVVEGKHKFFGASF